MRVFAPGDTSGVVSLILPIQRDEFGIPITLEAQPDLLDIAGFYQRARGNFWIAASGTELVGTIALLDIGGGQLALRKMFVKQGYRGGEHRVAQRLLDAALEWCAMREVGEIYLGTTAQFLAAHRFYEKNGFTEVDQGVLPASFPVMSVDTKFYWRRVTSL